MNAVPGSGQGTEERWVSADHREIGAGLEQHRKAHAEEKAVGAGEDGGPQ